LTPQKFTCGDTQLCLATLIAKATKDAAGRHFEHGFTRKHSNGLKAPFSLASPAEFI
jgi:hypothetical protein